MQAQGEINSNTPRVSPLTESPVPRIDSAGNALRELLRQSYGLRVTRLTRLDGYYDLNYHVTAELVEASPHMRTAEPDGYFLKVSNLNDSRRYGLLYGIERLSEHLLSKGVVCQRVVHSLEGKGVTQIASTTNPSDKDDKVYLASLRTYLPGKVLRSSSLTPDLLYDLGVFVADVTQKLQDFYEPYFDTFDSLWNLTNVSQVAGMVSYAEDVKRRDICLEVIKSFQTDVLPVKKQLRTGQIHGDLNEHNILIGPDSTPEMTPRICGLLDLHDTIRSHLVYDVAICAAHQMIWGQRDVPTVDIPGYLLAGYLSVMPLTQAEWAVLRPCIAARIVMVVLGALHTARTDPHNSYAQSGIADGWQALEEFWDIEPAEVDGRWKDVINSFQR